ncbi:MAG: hypothetical protein ACOYOA_11750 [Saprospiraceae bacterium]
MKKIINYTGTLSFAIEGNLLAIVRERTVIVVFKNLCLQFKENTEFDLQEIHLNNDIVWVNTLIDGLGITVEGHVLARKPFFIKGIDSEHNLFCSLAQNGAKVDNDGLVLWHVPEKFFIFLIGGFFYYVKNQIELAVIAASGQEIWKYLLPLNSYAMGEYGIAQTDRIERIIGEYNGLVWIVTNLGHLIGLSIQNGIVVHYLTVPVNTPASWGTWEIFMSAVKGVIDQNSGILFGLDNKTYWECNLNDPENTYLYYDISETCTANNISANMAGYYAKWQDDEIIFGQQEFGTYPSYVGIFNRKSKQITWTSREMGDEGIFRGLRQIDYLNNRLYVLDAEQTLHVFEREGLIV